MRVTTSAGIVDGTVTPHGHLFAGLPYAAPPVGSRRFAPPAPPERWDGVRPAQAHGPAAPQTAAVGPRPLLDLTVPRQSEDCLTVSVWTPSPDPAARLPVLVWIHGGAYVTGGASVPAYDGARLAARGAVVVGVTYRLGLLGWLRCAALGASGNQGQADQLAALTWVQHEIAAFGGDPDNVTVFGESAGAGSIAAHLAASSAPPFRRAILQSGAHNLAKTVEQADDTAARVLAVVDGDTSRLATMSAADVLAVQDAATPRSGGVFYGPVTDGDLVPADPARELAAGRSTVPVLVGTNRHEMGFFWGRIEGFDTVEPAALRAMAARWHTDPDAAVAAYRSARAARGEATDDRSLLVAMGSDGTFRAGAMAIAAWQPRAHAYRFDHESPLHGGLVGAGHVIEVPFVFGTQDHPSVAAYTGADADPEGTAALADEVGAAWLAFARDGEPGWSTYSSAVRTTRRFGGEGGTFVDDGAELAVWDPLALPG